MARSFSKTIHFDKKQALAVVIPHRRQDGLYYEVNIAGFPRFFMTWTELGRFDAIGDVAGSLPYNLVLAVSDILEQEHRKK